MEVMTPTSLTFITNEGPIAVKERNKVVILACDIHSQPQLHPYQILSKALKGRRS